MDLSYLVKPRIRDLENLYASIINSDQVYHDQNLREKLYALSLLKEREDLYNYLKLEIPKLPEFKPIFKSETEKTERTFKI